LPCPLAGVQWRGHSATFDAWAPLATSPVAPRENRATGWVLGAPRPGPAGRGPHTAYYASGGLQQANLGRLRRCCDSLLSAEPVTWAAVTACGLAAHAWVLCLHSRSVSITCILVDLTCALWACTCSSHRSCGRDTTLALPPIYTPLRSRQRPHTALWRPR
jgi:hypothetical protein